MQIMFIGERRSDKAKTMNVRWEDGRLAAKQLFDALKECGVDPTQHIFVNWFEKGSPKIVAAHIGIRCAMGRKVQRELALRGLVHIPLVHPAARGSIRRKDRYAAHVAEVLAGAGVTQMAV